jgi:tRNA(fMet)-specific endonuclease VapC
MSTGGVIAGSLYLLDTNILVAYARFGFLGQAIEASYLLTQTPNVPLISVVSRGEMLSIAGNNNWGTQKKNDLANLLNTFITVDINNNMIIGHYAEIDVFSRRSGHPMGKNDVWIAATAKATQARLLTTDQDFDHLCPAHLIRDYIDPKTHQILHG